MMHSPTRILYFFNHVIIFSKHGDEQVDFRISENTSQQNASGSTVFPTQYFSYCAHVHTPADLLVCGTLEGTLCGKADGTICCLTSVSETQANKRKLAISP